MKPIFLVREPSYAIGRSQETQERLKHLGDHYYVIVVVDNSISEFQFEMYNIINSPEVDIDELRKELETFNTEEK